MIENKTLPSDEEISQFAKDAITKDGQYELTERSKLHAQLVELGAKWMRESIRWSNDR